MGVVDMVSEGRRTAVVVEDDPDIRSLLEAVLTEAGFEVVLTENGFAGIEAVREHSPVLTTLDVSMPGIDGFATATRIREFSDTYIVMLTARDEEIDTIQGLSAGADDYITKPFRPRVLRARIDALLRRPRGASSEGEALGAERADAAADRSPADEAAAPAAPAPRSPRGADRGGLEHGAPHASTAPSSAEADREQATALHATAVRDLPEPAEDVFVLNGLRVDLASRIVHVGDDEVPLTRTEFDLLATLMESGRRVRNKADLALTLRGEGFVTSHYVSAADRRAVEVHMGNLRKKLGDSTSSPRWIETVRGVGYRLASPF